MPRRAQKKDFQTAFPAAQDGHLGEKVIEIGIREGKLIPNGERSYQLEQELLRRVEPYLSSRGIVGFPPRKRNSRSTTSCPEYIEEFVGRVQQNLERKRVRCLYRETSCWEKEYNLPVPIGLGLVAVHLYYRER